MTANQALYEIERSGSWKGFGSGAPCILGIDEAGRGPVLGPMVYGCAASPLDCENELKELGVADSKALTETKREEIFTDMCTNKSTMQIVAYAVCCLSPQHISTSMLRRRKCSLNEISHMDTVGPKATYQLMLEKLFPGIAVTVTEKADALFPIVSAASVAAKVTRDHLLRTWKFSEHGVNVPSDGYGSGYPGDPSTKKFLVESLDPVFGYSSLVRFSWKTAEILLDKHCVDAQWWFRVYASAFPDSLGKLVKKLDDFQLADRREIQAQPPTTHLRTVVCIMSLKDSPNLWMKELPEIVSLFRWQDGVYHPILYVAELMSREKDLVQLEPNTTVASFQIIYQPVSLGKIRFHRMITSSLAQLLELGFTQRDIEDVKGIFGDTNLYLLGVTIFVSAIHILFDVLSFKNDISFWRSRKSMVGLSTKALLWRCFSYTVIFFYLKDQDTSLLVIVPAGISVLIEFWKLKKAFKISFSWRRGVKFGAHTAEEAKTDAFDNEAMKYLMWLMTPLCIGGAVYSWFVESLANGVYAFGFLFMLPQLFVNYKLKSVAHLPWRAFTYKAFNTFIDDLFAFIIVMPTSHRVACFRDDIVFMVYLYQRYLYPVDHSRINEFGETGDVGPVVEKQADKISDDGDSEKVRTRKKVSKKID
ncbi:unnamed protein product [Angiostrongylus costaricensis]|uniref:Ribonuclease n=1 Tax=Angiostrongylus costaricensis TaxID=334426 RepID=A0A158PDX1_ANGCS|nr:unnamed protein product [Angiostrongylus costaricensis]